MLLSERILKKHVVILHAYSLMSSLQRKIFNVLLYEAKNSANLLQAKTAIAIECHMPVANLCKTIKFKSNNMQYLKESVDGLASLKIEWNLLKDKAPTDISFLNLRILHGSPTFYQDNTLNFSFHKIMWELIENPAVYGIVDIDLQSQFDSKYSHSLYENSTRLINLQKNKIIPIDIFKKLLGVPKNKYLSTREFTRNVLAPSLEEVNDRANFTINLNKIKIGRKISGIELEVKNKKISTRNKISNPQLSNQKEKVYEEIKGTFGPLSEVMLQKILKNYSEEYIFEKIVYTKKYTKKDSDFYPIRYFISALQNDYKLNENQINQNEKNSVENHETEWEKKLKYLQYDLNHWNKMLEFALHAKHKEQVLNIKRIIHNCEEKLCKHNLDKLKIEAL